MAIVRYTLEDAYYRCHGENPPPIDSFVVRDRKEFLTALEYWGLTLGNLPLYVNPQAVPRVCFIMYQGELVTHWEYSTREAFVDYGAEAVSQ